MHRWWISSLMFPTWLTRGLSALFVSVRRGKRHGTPVEETWAQVPRFLLLPLPVDSLLYYQNLLYILEPHPGWRQALKTSVFRAV